MVVVERPLQPLVAVRLAHDDLDDAVAGMRLHVVADTIGQEVARQEHDAVLVDGHVTKARVGNLQQRVQHVLDRLGTLGELIQHDDDRLALVQPEPSVRVVAGNLGLVVDHRHGDVAKVHVRHVHVGFVMGSGQHRVDNREHRALADAGFAANEEPHLGVGHDKLRRLLE